MPFGGFVLKKVLVKLDACVVDENIDFLQTRCQLPKSSDDLLLDTNICAYHQSLTTRPPDKHSGLFNSAGIPVDETYGSPVLGKQNSRYAANSRSRSGNDSDLSFKVHVSSECIDRNFGGFRQDLVDPDDQITIDPGTPPSLGSQRGASERHTRRAVPSNADKPSGQQGRHDGHVGCVAA